MEDLINALLIFKKYRNSKFPTNCEHDVLMIMEIEKDELSEEDKKEVARLGFFWSESEGCWSSFKFGSA